MENLLANTLGFWNQIGKRQQELILSQLQQKAIAKGETFVYAGSHCDGVQIVKSGQLRIFIMSPNGNQITLYRLLEKDICILSAACMMQNIDFDIHIEAERDSEVYIIPSRIFEQIKEESLSAANFMLEMLSSRFSDVMWVINQLIFSSMGRRLAEALLEHSRLSGSPVVVLTHDMLAKDIGTAREVVTRMLKQFQLDGLVKLSRGKLELLDAERLRRI